MLNTKNNFERVIRGKNVKYKYAYKGVCVYIYILNAYILILQTKGGHN